MERTQVLELMSTLKLYGMRSAYDEVMSNGLKWQHEPPHIVGNLLQSEIAEKQARSIRYQLSITQLPLTKDVDDFDFAGTPVNESLVRKLATGTFVADQCNVVLVGGTGTGKSHLAIAIARALLIRNGTRGRFFNVVDLVNRLETDGIDQHSFAELLEAKSRRLAKGSRSGRQTHRSSMDTDNQLQFTLNPIRHPTSFPSATDTVSMSTT